SLKLKNSYLNMLKELPKSIESRSGQLLVKLGIIKKHGKGIYFFTPFGLHLLNNVKAKVKEKLVKENFAEIDIPIINLKNNFNEKGYFESKDIDGKSYLTRGTDLYLYEDYLKNIINSYKDLPVEFFYINKKAINDNKANEELLNPMSTEIYKSFSVLSKEQYQERVRNYKEISLEIIEDFGISPINIKKHKESQGIIYGWLSKKGNEKTAYCPKCKKYHDVNYMEVSACTTEDEEVKELKKLKTPNIKTIEDLQEFTKTDIKKLIKAVLLKVVDKNYVVFIRGDRELSKSKLVRLIKSDENLIKQASEEDLEDMGTTGGFVGPIGLKNCQIIVDEEVKHIKNGIAGANEIDYHIENINYSRDFEDVICGDIVIATDMDKCIECNTNLEIHNYYRIGELKDNNEIYYDEADIKYIDNTGKENSIYKIENSLDLYKIISVSLEEKEDNLLKLLPWDINILLLKTDDEDSVVLGEKIYNILKNNSRKPLLDDRNMKVGNKFKEGELLNINEKIIIGRRAKEGIVEYQNNEDDKKIEITLEEIDKL
ncbi:MAG: YbaK/EbsC family protein, partial [Bacillota bacterium]|nr:YbaK/EbsC family protein [Bacillota bacterium]